MTARRRGDGKKLRHGEKTRGRRSEVRGRKSEDRSFKALNIEQQNKEPQNDEVVTSIFKIPCLIFYGFIRKLAAIK
jgi:hypothetical protein